MLHIPGAFDADRHAGIDELLGTMLTLLSSRGEDGCKSAAEAAPCSLAKTWNIEHGPREELLLRDPKGLLQSLLASTSEACNSGAPPAHLRRCKKQKCNKIV